MPESESYSIVSPGPRQERRGRHLPGLHEGYKLISERQLLGARDLCDHIVRQCQLLQETIDQMLEGGSVSADGEGRRPSPKQPRRGCQ